MVSTYYDEEKVSKKRLEWLIRGLVAHAPFPRNSYRISTQHKAFFYGQNKGRGLPGIDFKNGRAGVGRGGVASTSHLSLPYQNWNSLIFGKDWCVG